MSKARTIRQAILVAFIGATFWAVAPLLGAPTVPTSDIVNPFDSAAAQTAAREYLHLKDARNQVVARVVQSEIAVVTIAAVAWVLAGMVKSKV